MSVLHENGETLKNICESENHDCFRDKLAEKLNIIKSCNQGQSRGNCWHLTNEWHYLNGSTAIQADVAGLILSDGTLLKIWYTNASCKGSKGSISICGDIFYDVNGFKGPNVLGIDIF